jgi:hypothetical protein
MNAAKIRCVVASLFLVLTACPAADLPDGNDADAGPGDEGEGEGEETICDSGDCLCYPEPFDDLYDATGRPIYENCHFGPQMLKLCEGDECADTDAEQDALDRIMSIAVERDYPATMDLRYLYVDDVDVNSRPCARRCPCGFLPPCPRSRRCGARCRCVMRTRNRTSA